jgi:hypothetical protein
MKNFCSCIVGIAMLGVFTATVFAGVLVLKDFPIQGALAANDCTGEVLTLSGTAHVVVKDGGNVHLKIADVSAEGVDSGDVWTSKSVSVQNGTTSTDENGASNTTTVFRIRLENGDDSFQAKITAHTTVDANGNVTSDFVTDEADCK